MDMLHSVKIILYLLGQIRISGQEDVKRLNACFHQLEALRAALEAPDNERSTP